MRGYLRLLVMGHGDSAARRHSGDAPPFGDAARYGGINVEDVHRARANQVAAAEARDLTLARRHRQTTAFAYQRQTWQLVVPDDRLLEPSYVEPAYGFAKRDRLRNCPSLVGIARNQE